MNEETLDMQKSIDCGLRVGLAVLTEAVLVAPLDGIGDVGILNNADGTGPCFQLISVALLELQEGLRELSESFVETW